MKIFLAFVRKEFLHVFRDYRTLIVLFGMPIAQVLLFGYAISTDIRDAGMVIWDQSRDAKSEQLINNITASGFFLDLGRVESQEAIHTTFKDGKAKIALVIEPDFYANLIKNEAHILVIADASDPNTGNILSNQLNGIIQTWGLRQSNFLGKMPVINAEVRMHYNPAMQSAYLFVPGVITIILMLVSTMLTSIAITKEKEMGNMEILLVSPLKPIVVILGKIVPYMVLSLVNASVILAMGHFIFEVPIRGSLLLLFAESLLFIMVSLSIGVLISTKAKSQQIALMLSLFALMMPTILLSGFIFPIDSMPVPLQFLSNIMPPKYFIIILRSLMLKGAGISIIWKETLVLLGMAIFFIALSIRNYKIRLE